MYATRQALLNLVAFRLGNRALQMEIFLIGAARTATC